MARLLYVVNHTGFFLSHRLPLALATRAAGHDVHVATGPDGREDELRATGLPYHELPLSRTGRDPAAEARTVGALVYLYRKIRPDIVHHVTIKPVLYGGIAAKIARVPGVVHAVSGLGYVFLAPGKAAEVRRRAILAGYKLSLAGRKTFTIFQNEDDRGLFLRAGAVKTAQTVLIRGSGVDIETFAPTPEPEGTPVIVLPSRLLRDKGVGEFVEAARILKRGGLEARFVLVGDTDRNPASFAPSEIDAWVREGVVEWWGHRRDMPTVLAASHIVCLPSYREGMPKALLEGMAAGRPIVTTDVPGCRDVVTDGDNGLLVPAKSSEQLAKALDRLVGDQALRARLGARSRSRAVEEFSLAKVVTEQLALYTRILAM